MPCSYSTCSDISTGFLPNFNDPKMILQKIFIEMKSLQDILLHSHSTEPQYCVKYSLLMVFTSSELGEECKCKRGKKVFILISWG